MDRHTTLNNEDNPIINEKNLTGISMFEQLYFIGKILGESELLKMIMSKCVMDWQITGEISIVNIETDLT